MTTWRAIPHHPGYEASEDGRIRSVNRTITDTLGRTRHLKGKELAQFPGGDGYLRVGLGLVNRLVCMAFHGLPADPELHAAHDNGDKQDNTPGNLYWATVTENNRDILRHGHHHNANKTACIRQHQLEPDARRCRECHRERCRDYRDQNRQAVRARGLESYHRRKTA